MSHVGYAAGDVANNLVFSFQAMFLVVYYVNVARLQPVDVGVLLLVVRVWSAACDLIAGRMVDRRTSPGGRFRPYLLWATPPLLLSSLAVFSVPVVDGYGLRLFYAWVTSAVMMLFYSLVTIPYVSLASAMTADPHERVGLNSWRMGGVMLVQLVLAAVVSPQITRLASDPGALQGFFTAVAGANVVLGLVLYWTCHRTCHEVVPVDVQPLSLRATWEAVRTNRPLLVLCTSTLAVLAGQFTIVGAQAHYAMLVLGDSGLLFWMSVASAVSALVMVPFAPRLSARIGVRTAYVGMATTMALGALGIALAPTNIPFVLACFVVQGLGAAPINALMYTLAAACVDHGRRTRGTSTPGAVFATFHVSRKVAQAVAGGVTGIGLGLAGVTASTMVGDPRAVPALVLLVSVVPGVLVLVGGALILAFPRSGVE
ncbi:MAG TPA: hypothetical protein GXZ45_07175 [Propionibacterium sp.]|nr:hypothetical protein [Propionibacterium sp.]